MCQDKERNQQILEEQARSDANALLEGIPGFDPSWYEWFINEEGEIDNEGLADYLESGDLKNSPTT